MSNWFQLNKYNSKYSPLLFFTIAVILVFTISLLWVSQTRFVPKKVSYQLAMNHDRIPFLIEEKDPLHETRLKYYLGVWDLGSNSLSSDQSAIGFVEGDCILHWQGNRRIFVASKNPSGKIYVETTNPYFEFVEFQANDPNIAQVLDDSASDLYYVLDRASFSEEYMIETWVREKKISTNSVLFNCHGEEVVDFIPLDFVWKNEKPYLIGEGYCEGIPCIFTGTFQDNQFLLQKSTDSILDWDRQSRSGSRVLFYHDALLLCQKNPDSVQSYDIFSPKRNSFETINNYIDMFRNYIFGTADRESSLIRRGIYLNPPQPVLPVVGSYQDYLVTKWKPDVQRIEEGNAIPFSVVQIQALKDNQLVNRIDQVGTLINVYSAFSTSEFHSEESNLYLERWILPNQ
ncbi:MAG TPA: hypothetical protein PLE09_04465 [Caldisericia bacterium]|nr:hypothetical protein [Caldisericia bacterium]